MAVLGSLFVMPVLLYSFARMEERVVPFKTRLFWSNLTNSFWYIFSVLVGENITEMANYIRNANAVR